MVEYRLGKWNLTELVVDPTKPEFEKQIVQVQKMASSFEAVKKKLRPNMPFDDFKELLRKLESLSEKLSIVAGYSSLLYSQDTQSDVATSLMTRMTKLSADVSNKLLFFDLWWKREVDEKNASRLMKQAGELEGYLRHKRLVAKYSLSEAEERIINILDVTGPTALVKLYDKITNSFEYEITIRGKKRKMTREELTSLVRNTNAKIREKAYKSLLNKFSSNKGVLGDIYQNIALNWKDEGIDIRGYPSPISVRNVANDVDDKTVDSLLDACKNNTEVFQKFFRQKAKMLRLKKLRRYDLYAPATSAAKERNYRYNRAVKLVLESLERFSPVLAGYAKRVFEEDHVDSSVRPGKRDGAFCSTLSPKITPFVLVNYTGKTRDVFTLAHELGHAVHSQAASKRSILVQDPSLPLAETASTFSELLLYDNLSGKVPQREEIVMLSEKIDDLYATIMRQSFFTLFEIEAHKNISGVTVAELSDIYLKNLKEQFGESVSVTDDFAVEWTCIPHFFHTPFYCYAYSFGNLLALSLFERYKREGKDFVPAYLDILSAGGSEKPEDLLSKHGIDISSVAFWQDGFDYVQKQVKRLSELS